MRDEFDARMWDAHHSSASQVLTQISKDCARGLEGARHTFVRRARNIGFHGTAMIAAAVVSGSSILATVGPVTGV
jgi:hypothetical protein